MTAGWLLIAHRGRTTVPVGCASPASPAAHVDAAYIEATPRETEARLAAAIRRYEPHITAPVVMTPKTAKLVLRQMETAIGKYEAEHCEIPEPSNLVAARPKIIPGAN